jgi:hypothetical protein
MIPRPLFHLYWQTRFRLKRLSRAASYATGRLSAAQARAIIFDCEPVWRRHALMHLSEESVMDDAEDTYGEAAHLLRPYIAEACMHVADRWQPDEELSTAHEWALDRALQHASNDGIRLNETEHTATPNPQGELAHA